MSYPSPSYHGDSGELTATVRNASAASELDDPTSAMSYLATGASTGGKFGLYRVDFKGPRGGPGPHFHRSISESFFILSGIVRIHDGRAWNDAGPGDFMHVPEGGIHGFRNDSGAPASMLLLATGTPAAAPAATTAARQRALLGSFREAAQTGDSAALIALTKQDLTEQDPAGR
ncbi:cupin domain-containing protein [Actinoplanes solisilvae]|uniref:cupin domain-containing protein n=1 Tax=Actinoplanes solisilvae TaxID=2486853 RepID=UPI000FD9DB09|nr:cupin domain-containing protein [Actinoplanes solisilvae]